MRGDEPTSKRFGHLRPMPSPRTAASARDRVPSRIRRGGSWHIRSRRRSRVRLWSKRSGNGPEVEGRHRAEVSSVTLNVGRFSTPGVKASPEKRPRPTQRSIQSDDPLQSDARLRIGNTRPHRGHRTNPQGPNNRTTWGSGASRCSRDRRSFERFTRANDQTRVSRVLSSFAAHRTGAAFFEGGFRRVVRRVIDPFFFASCSCPRLTPFC